MSNTVILENNVLLQGGATNLIDVVNKEFKGNADSVTNGVYTTETNQQEVLKHLVIH